MKLTRSRHIKLAIQKIVSLFPGKLGFAINQKLVNLSQGDLGKRFDLKRRVGISLKTMHQMRDHGGASFENESVLELGTGWHLVDPIVFWILGVERVDTIDHHQHFVLEDLKNVVKTFCEPDVRTSITECGLVESATAAQRLDEIKSFFDSGITSVDSILNFFNIHFWLAAQCNPDQLIAAEVKPVNIFFSNSVLQRIRTSDLERNIRRIGDNLLAPNAVAFHQMDQKDINAQEHVDPSVWALNYLRYSDWVFNHVLSCRFNYQNRLRASDFLRILGSAGLEHVFEYHAVRDEDKQKMAQVKLPKKFANYEMDDLVARASTIISVKKK